MRALSWKQPYATMMLWGKIETRTWYTDYRGLVLICASQRPYTFEDTQNISGIRLITNGVWQNHNGGRPWMKPEEFPCGVAIAVGELVGCRKMHRQDCQKAFVEFHPDLYCHFYDNVRPIKPFPFKGKQGWQTVPQSVIDQIEYIKPNPRTILYT